MSIELQHISKTFGPFRALDDINLVVPDGGLVARTSAAGSWASIPARICWSRSASAGVRRRLRDLARIPIRAREGPQEGREMGTKTLMFVTKDTPDGREGFRQALETASGLGARVSLTVVGGRPDPAELEALLRAAAFAEAGYFPGLQERLERDTRAASERAAESRAWFVREAEVAGVELEIRDGTADALAAVDTALASRSDVCQVLFGPAVLRDRNLDVRRLVSRIDRAVITITEPLRAVP